MLMYDGRTRPFAISMVFASHAMWQHHRLSLTMRNAQAKLGSDEVAAGPTALREWTASK